MRMPAYGKELMDLRRAGKRPADTVIICLDHWPQPQEPNPCIVIRPDDKIADMELRMLAHLDVVIHHRDPVNFGRMCELIDALMKLDISWLATASIDRLHGIQILYGGFKALWLWSQMDLADWYGWDAVRAEKQRQEQKECA
jgi:hypothetical protein